MHKTSEQEGPASTLQSLQISYLKILYDKLTYLLYQQEPKNLQQRSDAYVGINTSNLTVALFLFSWHSPRGWK